MTKKEQELDATLRKQLQAQQEEISHLEARPDLLSSSTCKRAYLEFVANAFDAQEAANQCRRRAVQLRDQMNAVFQEADEFSNLARAFLDQGNIYLTQGLK